MPNELTVRDQPTGMELLAELARGNKDPQAAIEIAKQIVALQVEQEKLRQSYERFEWEKYDREARVAFAQSIKDFKDNAPKILATKHVKIEKRDGTRGPEYWHVELDKACDLLIPALLKVGITHRWKSADLPTGNVRVTCFLKHYLGYEEEGATLAGPPDASGGKNPIQGIGSSNSYLERYTLLSTLGLVPASKDLDGNPPPLHNEEDEAKLQECKDALRQADDVEQLKAVFKGAYKLAKTVSPEATKAMTAVYEECKVKLL